MQKLTVKIPEAKQLPNGKWRMRIRRRGFQVSENFNTKRGAETWAKKKIMEIDARTFEPEHKPTKVVMVGDIIRQYRQYRGDDVGNTVRGTLKYLAEYFAVIPTTDLSPALIDKFIRHREGKPVVYRPNTKPWGPVQPGTIKKDLDMIRLSLEWGRDMDKAKGLEPEVVSTARRLAGKRVKGGDSRDRLATREEIDLMLMSTDIAVVAELSMLTGFRREEVCKVRPEMIKNGRVILENTKTKQGKKDVRFIMPRAEALIRANPQGFASRPMEITKQFNGWSHATNVEDLTHRDLRHVTATYAARAGIPTSIIRGITGHNTDKVLNGTYINLLSASLDPEDYHPQIMQHFVDFKKQIEANAFHFL